MMRTYLQMILFVFSKLQLQIIHNLMFVVYRQVSKELLLIDLIKKKCSI
ncbi:hypothetical protein OIU76_003941 [Salix suchowensis]|nr:hypothetical protein OIU78_013710 [Salix suchowensis]KAJ6347358.1 hypothetical protein OIU76_003941 [Salix suchowensis]